MRAIDRTDADRVAGFLDRNTLALRWLVAFFRNYDAIPEEARPYWGLWMEEGPLSDVRAVVAHSFHTGECYLAAAEDSDPGELEQLLARELLPEMLTADDSVLERCLSRSPGLLERARKRERLLILALEPAGEAAAAKEEPGFRPARAEDIPILRQYEMAYALETRRDVESDFDSLVAAGMVFVLEEEGMIRGTIRSNLSDGKYVHAGGVYVHPSFRGRGIGRRLVAALARRVHREQGAALLLDVEESNRAALRSYREAGCRELGRAETLIFPEGCWSGGGSGCPLS